MASLREWFAHPFAQATSVVAAVAAALHINALVGAVWAQAGALFTTASLFGFSLAPRVDAIPESAFTAVAVGTGLLLAAKRVRGLYDGFKERL